MEVTAGSAVVAAVRVMALVPARGGSKSVPRKNLRKLAGRSLVARAVTLALEACGNAYVSTDDDEIANEAELAGAGVIFRPSLLAQDDTPMLPVLQHALGWALVDGGPRGLVSAVDVVVLLQPTQPLRTVDHVYAALMLLGETKADSVVSVVEIPAAYNPERAVELASNGRMGPWDMGGTLSSARRRQDVTPAYSRDGTVYAIRREVIEAGSLYGYDCRALVIPPNESCNIDTEDDFRRAESMVRA